MNFWDTTLANRYRCTLMISDRVIVAVGMRLELKHTPGKCRRIWRPEPNRVIGDLPHPFLFCSEWAKFLMTFTARWVWS